jgi:hypothetical protein
MKATTLLLVTTLLGVSMLALPLGDIAPAGTASAYVCTLDDVSAESAADYADCQQDQAECAVRSLTEGAYCPR